eukprot:COSAG01_NODE_36560_length_516_cov_0.599520_1_plen_67_part_10
MKCGALRAVFTTKFRHPFVSYFLKPADFVFGFRFVDGLIDDGCGLCLVHLERGSGVLLNLLDLTHLL